MFGLGKSGFRHCTLSHNCLIAKLSIQPQKDKRTEAILRIRKLNVYRPTVDCLNESECSTFHSVTVTHCFSLPGVGTWP